MADWDTSSSDAAPAPAAPSAAERGCLAQPAPGAALALPNPGELSLRAADGWDTGSSESGECPQPAAAPSSPPPEAAAAPGPWGCYCSNAVLHGEHHLCTGYCRARRGCRGDCGTAVPALPKGWSELAADAGAVYYCFDATGATQWERPWEPPQEAAEEAELLPTAEARPEAGKSPPKRADGKPMKRAERERLDRERLKEERLEKERKQREAREEKRRQKEERERDEKDKKEKKKRKKERKRAQEGGSSSGDETAVAGRSFAETEISAAPGLRTVSSVSTARPTPRPGATPRPGTSPRPAGPERDAGSAPGRGASAWRGDAEANSCEGCNLPFTLTRRRHHCRHCGGVFCAACTPHRAPLLGGEQLVRVCTPCNTRVVAGI